MVTCAPRQARQPRARLAIEDELARLEDVVVARFRRARGAVVQHVRRAIPQLTRLSSGPVWMTGNRM